MVFLSGCAGATVSGEGAKGPMVKPDMIVVNRFAVTPSEVQLDRGLLVTAMRENGDRSLSEEELRVGHLVSERLSKALVKELGNVGITATEGSPQVNISPSTVVLNGEFVTIDQGDQTQRVWVGFGLGGSEVRTRIQAIQDGKLVAQAETATHSSLKPGMLVSIGAGAAAESGATVAMGAAGTGVSEAFLANVEADAQRTAKEIAKKIKDAYVDRGWLTK
jgi:hypothetical protein